MEMEGWWRWAVVGATGLGVLIVRRYMYGAVYTGRAIISGKTVIITGANCGIGKATAIELAKRKGRLILACRDMEKANHTASAIRSKVKDAEVRVKHLDLASLASVRQFAKEILEEEPKIDILVNNAGVFQCPYSKTEDGFEMQFGVNHLGHFLLTHLLEERLVASAPSRIVVVTSGLHKLGKLDFENLNAEKEYNKKMAYYNSKLANNLFARELDQHLEGTGVSVYTVRPGMVRTSLGRHVHVPMLAKLPLYPLYWLLVKGPYHGCQTVLYCCLDDKLQDVSGRYYGNCKEEPWTEVSLDTGVAKKLWEVSEKLVEL